MTIHGVCWVLIKRGHVLMEKCPKKAKVLGVGTWFIPGGKVEGDETPLDALERELREEWPTVRLASCRGLPIVEGSPVPPGPKGIFLMRPYAITVTGDIPKRSADGIELRWIPILDALLLSPVAQVRMMVAAANYYHSNA